MVPVAAGVAVLVLKAEMVQVVVAAPAAVLEF
jgi:hypothetical protein